MTWKSCDRVQSGLEGLRVQKDQEESRGGVRVRSDVKKQGFLMVYMVYACTTEMKRYDIKAHVGSMVALWKTHVDE